MSGLIKRWKVAKDKTNTVTNPTKPEEKTVGELGSALAGFGLKPVFITVSLLPPFPAFSNDWEPGIQAKWLEIYAELKELEVNNGTRR